MPRGVDVELRHAGTAARQVMRDVGVLRIQRRNRCELWRRRWDGRRVQHAGLWLRGEMAAYICRAAAVRSCAIAVAGVGGTVGVVALDVISEIARK
jgi:hypothetical protein